MNKTFPWIGRPALERLNTTHLIGFETEFYQLVHYIQFSARRKNFQGNKGFLLDYFQGTMGISTITRTQREHFRQQLNTLQGPRRYIKCYWNLVETLPGQTNQVWVSLVLRTDTQSLIIKGFTYMPSNSYNKHGLWIYANWLLKVCFTM